MRFTRTLTTALFVSTCLVLPPASASVPDAPTPKKEKKICREVGSDTGTRIPRKRVCRTAADWEAEAEIARKDLDELRNSEPSGVPVNAPAAPQG